MVKLTLQVGDQPVAIHEDCVLACPKGPTQESATCEANKCCPLPNGNVKDPAAAKSTNNTPIAERRTSSFVMDKNVRQYFRPFFEYDTKFI